MLGGAPDTPTIGDPRAQRSSQYRGRVPELLDPAASSGAPLGPAAADPLPRSTALRWVGLAMVGFLLAEVLGVALLSLVAALKGFSSGEATRLAQAATPPEWVIVSLLTGQWLAFLGAPYLATRLGPVRHRLGLAFRRTDLLGVPIGAAAQIVVLLAYLPFRAHLHHFDAPAQRLTGGSSGAGFVLIAALTILGAPFAEEVFFRGLLLRGLTGLSTGLWGRRRTWALAAAAVADGLLFGLAHGEWVQLPGLAAFGVLLALLTMRTGRLGTSIVAHCSFNALAIISIAVVGG